jgi:hypothetical protein
MYRAGELAPAVIVPEFSEICCAILPCDGRRHREITRETKWRAAGIAAASLDHGDAELRAVHDFPPRIYYNGAAFMSSVRPIFLALQPD